MAIADSRARRVRESAWIGISVLGVLLLFVPLYDMWDDVSNLSWGVTTTVVENLPLILLALGLVAGGLWVAHREWSPADVATTATWTLGIAAGTAFLYALVIVLQLWSMQRLKPWVLAFDGVLFGSVAAFVAGVYHARQNRSQRELQARERSLREMYDLVSDPSLAFEDQVEGVLDIGRDLFDAEYGSFARVDTETGEYRLKAVRSEDAAVDAGDVVPLSRTHCESMVRRNQTVQFGTRPYEDADGDANQGTDVGFETYVGTPVHENENVYGALCFLDRKRPDEFDDWQVALVELMGNWVGYELTRQRLLDERRQELRRREAQFESFVDAVDEYAIFTLDETGTVTSWNDGAEEMMDYAASDVVGERIDVFSPDDAADGLADELLSEARDTGQARSRGWYVRKDGTRFWADVTVASRHDDHGEHLGYTVITRDMTDRRERERTIERERERLEFMNRIIRHNILNGLNLVNARAEVLADRLSDDVDAQEHIDVVRNRVDDMARLIDTMRTFMDAVLTDETHETHPVSIRTALSRKLSLVQETYPDADVEAETIPDESVRVVADDLVGEVFENVLSNAVVHNDATSPRVEVWTTETTCEVPGDAVSDGSPLPEAAADGEWPAVTVHVADDGPGVPDDQKDAVLEKGVSELSEPGNGFGLYLVTEMMRSYGGRVDVRDNDPTGAVFSLTFPRTDVDDAAT